MSQLAETSVTTVPDNKKNLKKNDWKFHVVGEPKQYRVAIDHKLRKTDVVLELGCAGGNSTKAISEKTTFCVGVDICNIPGTLERQKKVNSTSKTKYVLGSAFDIRSLISLELEVKNKIDGFNGFDCIFIDLSAIVFSPVDDMGILKGDGQESELGSIMSLVDKLSKVFGKTLRLLVVKNINLYFLMQQYHPLVIDNVYDYAPNVDEMGYSNPEKTGNSIIVDDFGVNVNVNVDCNSISDIDIYGGMDTDNANFNYNIANNPRSDWMKRNRFIKNRRVRNNRANCNDNGSTNGNSYSAISLDVITSPSWFFLFWVGIGLFVASKFPKKI